MYVVIVFNVTAHVRDNRINVSHVSELIVILTIRATEIQSDLRYKQRAN